MSAPPPRVRRDPRDPASMRVRAPTVAAPAAAAAPKIVSVDDAAPFVLAVSDLDAGRLSRDDRDLLGAARRLADDLGGGVVLAMFMSDSIDLRFKPELEGADRVVVFRNPAFAAETAESRVAAVLAAAEASRARHILVSDTPLGGELARRVAARLGDRPAFDVRRLGAEELAADIDGGRTEVRRSLPLVIVPARAAFPPVNEAAQREARVIPVPIEPTVPRVKDLGLLPPDPATLPLAEADLIISAGSGLTDWGSFHAAAEALGAAEAGSRVVCDSGLLPRNRQVGASGLLVEPRCYLAFGIAGASQHLQGIAAAERVIAVNTDLRAEMVKRADLAIVADAQDVLPALVRRARERRSHLEGSSFRGGDAEPGTGEPIRAPVPDLRVVPSGMRGSRPGSPDIVALVSIGVHPVSRRARRAELDARALELALGCGSTVTALHAGAAEPEVLRDYLGAGATDLVQLETASDADPLPALETWLRETSPQLVVSGTRAEAGECSGTVPFILAERLGFALATDIVALEIEGGMARLIQAVPGGKRRRLEAPLPLIVTVGRPGPDPRLSARMRAMRGALQRQPVAAGRVDERPSWPSKPSRPRPKRIVPPPGPGQAPAADTGRREMIGPTPDEAADAILDFLARDGLFTAQPGPEAIS